MIVSQDGRQRLIESESETRKAKERGLRMSRMQKWCPVEESA